MNLVDNSRKALGRGLGALIPGAAPQAAEGAGRGLTEIAVGEVLANKYQPRRDFNEEALAELAESIRSKGILQPVVVRRSGEKYELIAGERRLRAAKMAGLSTIPAVIKDVSDLESLELALIENIQRRDLNPIEEARSYMSLVSEFGLTQEDVASRVGRERSTVANTLRLLKLPEAVQKDLAGGVLTMGHARALLSLEEPSDQMQLRAEVIGKALSVRATEALVARWRPRPRKKSPAPAPRVDVEMKKVTEDLKRRLGTRVHFRGSQRKGRIEIQYTSLPELNRILALLLDR